MSDFKQDDEDSVIEAEIQRELDALNLEDEEESDSQAGLEEYQQDEDTDANDFPDEMPDCISDFIQRVQSRAKDFQKELSECDSLLSGVMTVKDEEREEFFYQSKALKEFAFQIGEDPEELRDRVIQELAEEDEEDSKPLPIDDPGVKVLALEGPLFEEQNEDSTDGPLLALEGPPTDEDGQVEGKEVVVAEAEKGLQVYKEPVQQFEGAARKKVKEFEDRYETQLQEYRKDYEEGQRLRVRREKEAEEDRARRRRENDEEQRLLAQERMMYQSQIQEKLDELEKNTKESLENYQNEIKKLEARTNQEKKEFEEQYLHHQQQIAVKRLMAATKIQSVYRSYRARKPFLKKMRLIKEEVRKKMIDKRQMEIAAQKKQEEQKKRKEREEKKRKEEEMRRKMEEERRKQEEDERLERERLEKERLEKERWEREEMERKRAEEERKEKEQREMEEKANEILAKIMKEKQSNNSEGTVPHRVGDGSLVQPAVKVNIINSQDMNIHHANEGLQMKAVDKSVSDDGVKSDKVEKEGEKVEKQGLVKVEKNSLEEGVRVQRQNDYVGKAIVGTEDARKGRENLLESQCTDSDQEQFAGIDNRDRIVNSELTNANQWQGENVEEKQTEVVGDIGKRGKVKGESAIENLSLNLDIENGKVDGESAQMKEKLKVKTEDRKEPKKDETFQKSSGAGNGVKFNNSNRETETDQEYSKSNTSFELNAKTVKVDEDVERDIMGNFDVGNSEKAANMDGATKSKILHGKDGTETEKSLNCEGEEAKAESENQVAIVTSSYSPAKLDVGSYGGSKESLDKEYERARLEWMKTSIPFSKQLIQAKEHLHEQEKKKRRYLRRPSAVKKMTEISEEQLLAASPIVNTLAEVTTVELQDLPGCVMTTLCKCPNLRAFVCHSSEIQCLEGLDQSPDISYIDVKGNQLANVSCRDRTRLTFLDLSKNNLSTVQGLEGCTSLKWLNLSHNRISRLSGIEYLLSLVHLDVSNNQLINGQGLSALVHLVSLDASNNHLSTIPSLDSCILLRIVNFRGNSLSEVPDFSNHVLLTELFLDNNSLVSMETMKLSWLPRLQCLSLSQNSLQTVPVLKYALLLKKLDLRNNYITDISSLSDGLSCLPSLEHLHIDGNPVTEESDCRAEIIKLVPSLQSLEDETIPSSASQRPHSQFEEMCLSQITAEDALKERHLEVIQSLKKDDRYLQNVASTWSSYLDFWLKVVIDHRYMHEYGDLSLVTCEVKDLCRMIPDPGARERGTSSEENEKYSMKQEDVDGTMSHVKDTKNTIHLKTGGKGTMKGVESAQSLERNGNESMVDKNALPPSPLKATDVRNEVYSSDESRQIEAATRIQALWRGFEVRRDLELHSKQYLAAVLIQSIWRGHRVRQRYLKARAALQNQKSEEQEEEEFDFNEDLDLEFLEFSEENLEKGWLPSEIPEVPSSHPVLPPKHNKTSPLHERPLSSISTSMPTSPEKFALHPPKQAWRGTNSPLAPIGNHVSAPQDKTIVHGKPPLPPVTPVSSRTESVVSSNARTARSKKEQELSEEWGFKDNITAELMMKRAKKMNQSRKKKNLDPVKKYQMFKKLQESQTTREVQHQCKRGVQRKEYFKAKEEAVEQKTKEIHERTYQWVHSQTAYPDDESILVDSNFSFRSRHSSSEPSLPRMSPDVLQGRVHLTASPTIDLQSVDGSSINEVAVRGRSNSFSSPDGERLPPIKTNSAPTSHIRQRQAAKGPPSNEGAYNTRQAWGKSPRGKRR